MTLSRAFWRLKRFIKQTPVLWAAYTSLRATAARLRGRKPDAPEEPTDDTAEKRSPPLATQ